MKKLTLLCVAVLMSVMVFADGYKTLQKKSFSYNPNPKSGNVVPALNLYTGPAYYSGFGMSIGGDYEIPMLVDNLTLGPGANIGFGRNSHVWGHYTRFDLVANVVGHYYFDWLIPDMPDEFDAFFTAAMGLRFRTFSDHYDGYYGVAAHTKTYSNIRFNFESYIGGRWNFSPNMSLYAKFGYGSYYTAVGISFKL